jgi:hypothetical protein
MKSLAVELVVEAVQELIVDPGKRLGPKKKSVDVLTFLVSRRK